MTRAEHLEWAKQRAFAYCDAGDPRQAFASLASDLRKHADTAGHPALQLGLMEQMSGRLATAADMRTFIAGCN